MARTNPREINMINLINLYQQLKQPVKVSESQARFSACAIPGYTKHRLAKNVNGFPCLLIATQDSSTTTRPAPIRLEHLEVLYDVNCRISNKNTLEASRFTVICCKTEDYSMQEYFLQTGNAIVELIGDIPTHKQVAKAVDNLVELFRALNEAPRKSVQGLWAEVFVISIATNPIALMKAWHRSPEDQYDFGAESQRIEVKSATSSKLRQHHFSLEQLNPPQGVDVLVASIFIERIGAGTSLADLIEVVRKKINNEPELLLYLDQIVGATLGNNWKSASKDRFDYNLAKKSLSFYSSETIPKISPNIPKEVNSVHFIVDLTNVSSVDKKKYKSEGSIFKAVIS